MEGGAVKCLPAYPLELSNRDAIEASVDSDHRSTRLPGRVDTTKSRHLPRSQLLPEG
jgi:hypothetical protein